MPRAFLPLAAIIAAALPAAAQAQDAQQWQGFYGGLSMDHVAPDVTAGAIGIGLSSDLGVGVFAGYNQAVGNNFVVGGELSYGAGTSHDLVVPLIDVELQDRIELSARAGYATGNTLLYGSLGYMQADYGVPIAGFEDTASGMTLGLGMETMLAENWSLRLDYEHAVLQPDDPILGGVELEADTLSLGVAFHF